MLIQGMSDLWLKCLLAQGFGLLGGAMVACNVSKVCLCLGLRGLRLAGLEALEAGSGYPGGILVKRSVKLRSMAVSRVAV
mgnify:CR=1 FL=1